MSKKVELTENEVSAVVGGDIMIFDGKAFYGMAVWAERMRYLKCVNCCGLGVVVVVLFSGIFLMSVVAYFYNKKAE